MKLPILYKRTELGQIQTWQICVENDSFYTIEGILNGTLTTSKPTVCSGKNISKQNETSPQVQAEKQATAKWKKKQETGYVTDINNIDIESFFQPMLAKKYLEYQHDITFPVLVSYKIDGARLVAMKNGCWTRNNKQYFSCPHINEILKPLFDKHPNWVIDSEIYSHDIPFEEIMSIVRKTKPTEEDIKRSKEIVKIYIFDGVVDDTTLGFSKRFEIIQNEITKIIGPTKYIQFVPTTLIYKPEQIYEYHDLFVAQGYEGLMVRIDDKPYENKRSKYLLKYKQFLDEEFKIVDILEGIGQRSGMAGKIVCELKNKETVEAGIRGGESYYIELLKNKKNYIGKLATIRYQGYTDKGSLRFPVAININPLDR
jgi:DNA ligase-1